MRRCVAWCNCRLVVFLPSVALWPCGLVPSLPCGLVVLLPCGFVAPSLICKPNTQNRGFSYISGFWMGAPLSGAGPPSQAWRAGFVTCSPICLFCFDFNGFACETPPTCVFTLFLALFLSQLHLFCFDLNGPLFLLCFWLQGGRPRPPPQAWRQGFADTKPKLEI